MAFGMNASTSNSSMDQDVFGGQDFQDFYKNMNSMFGNTMNNASGMNSQAQGLNPFFSNMMNTGSAGANSLLGGGSSGGYEDELMQKIMQGSGGRSNMGTMYESIVGGEGNSYIDPMVSAMKRSSMDNLDRMQSGTGLDAAAMGQGGSSRHAMQNAMQGKEMNNDMLDRESMMRGGAYDKDLAMKMGIAQQADTNKQSELDRYSSLLGRSDQNTMGGLQSMSGLGQFGMQSMNPMMMSMMAPYYAMQMQGNAMGDPTVTTSQDSNSYSGGFGL